MKLKCRAAIEQTCESCSMINCDYEIGLEDKIDKLQKLFPSCEIDQPIRTLALESYRNKAKFVIGGTLENPILGIPSINKKFEITSLEDCPIHNDKLNKIALFIKALIPLYKLIPYDIKSKKGEFKYLILTIGKKTNDISIRFGMRSLESYDRVKKMVLKLQNNFFEIKVVSFEVQPKHAAVLEGKTYFLTDSKFIRHEFNHFNLLSSTTNFFQINSEVAQLLYQNVYDRYKDEDINIAIDLFCGVGGFSQAISRFSRKVIGIELNENAIECAKELKTENIDFYCDDAFKFRDYHTEAVDLLIVNPPRRGIGEKFSKLICEIKPKFFVYSSCNPTTLKEDSNILMNDFVLENVIPVDMFALTEHLEVLTFWKRK